MDKLSHFRDHVLIFRDNTKLYVAKDVYFSLLEDSATRRKFFVDGNGYDFNDVKYFLTPEEHKKKFPTIRYENFSGKGVDRFMKDKTPESRLVAIEKMAKGLKAYIESKRYQGTEEPNRMLQKMRFQYAQAKAELT